MYFLHRENYRIENPDGVILQDYECIIFANEQSLQFAARGLLVIVLKGFTKNKTEKKLFFFLFLSFLEFP